MTYDPDNDPILERIIAGTAAKRQPLPAPETATLPANAPADLFSDMRMAAAFAQRYQEIIRYWPEAGKFLFFDGRRWTTDLPGGAFPFIREQIEHLYKTAIQCQDYEQRTAMMKAIFKLESHQRQETILSAVKVRPELIVTTADLDQHPMLMTCNNGTLDLATGTLRPSRAEDLLTRMTPIEYRPFNDCPVFEKFLDRILDGNQEVISFLQRFIGYCLTGMTTEQVLLFLYGTGSNGKTVLANVIGALIGDYGSTAESDLLMAQENRGSTNDVAKLRGSRLVKVSEFDDGEKLAEARIKTLTGGDPVTCRFLFREFFTYTPTYKILLIGNHKPKVRGTDHGIWRRLLLLNFNVTIQEGEKDPHLPSKLLAELPGILSWAVQGCLEWQQQGLAAPAEVRAATTDYRKSEDTFEQWIDECCTRSADQVAGATELLHSFIEYSKWKATSTNKFARMLKEADSPVKDIVVSIAGEVSECQQEID